MLGAVGIDAQNLRGIHGHRGIDGLPVGVLDRNLLKRWRAVPQATLQVRIACELGRIDGGKKRVERNRRPSRVGPCGRAVDRRAHARARDQKLCAIREEQDVLGHGVERLAVSLVLEQLQAGRDQRRRKRHVDLRVLLRQKRHRRFGRMRERKVGLRARRRAAERTALGQEHAFEIALELRRAKTKHVVAIHRQKRKTRQPRRARPVITR